jgi:N6-adenosine-specific RNA methylase IME4
MEISIDREFRSLIPPLRPEERAGLEASLKAEGCRDALVVWRNGKDTLLDGHNRYEICERLKLPFKTKPLDFPSRDHALLWIEENQLGRRNLSDDQRAMVAQGAIERRSKLRMAEQRKAAAESRWHKDDKCEQDNVSRSHAAEIKPATRTEVARENNIPERKLRTAAEIKKASPELAQKVRDGAMPLAAARREIKRTEIVQKLESVDARKAKELAGLYDVMVVDPPWPMEKIERDERPNQVKFDYPVMSLDDIQREVGAKLTKHAAMDCHVFLWTTQKFLPVALKLLEAWGLKYVCTFVWHKPGGFQPIGLPQYNCEFAIYARKGAPRFVDTKALPLCFQAPRAEHSAKPEQFYEVLRRVTAGRRLDLFNRREIVGFDGWGKES